MLDPVVFLAFSPILLLLVLMVFVRRPLFIAAPVAYLYTLLLVVTVWALGPGIVISSSMRGAYLAVDIIIIIFGAIFFLDFLKLTGLLDDIRLLLGSFSHDRRVQAILLVWFFGSFIEGTAGFGTPAAIVAPLLVGLGFPAISAIVLSLMGNNASVVFGAVGTPIRVGFVGLETSLVPLTAALIAGLAGLLVPVMILGFLAFGQRRNDLFWDGLAFSLWSGVCFMVPYVIASLFGPEFPSLVGPLVGLGLIILSLKFGVFVPKILWKSEHALPLRKSRPLVAILLPYGFLVGLLFVGKLFLRPFTFSLGEGFSFTVDLFNPGLAFVLAVALYCLVYRIKASVVVEASREAAGILLKPFVAILFLAGMVYLMINSGSSGVTGMVSLIGGLLNSPYLYVVAPFVGAFGSFIAGSATVSNLIFGTPQQVAASFQGYAGHDVLALQAAGAGAGNMIALTNIVAAQATVKRHGDELEILGKMLGFCLLYLFLVVIFGFFVRWLSKSFF